MSKPTPAEVKRILRAAIAKQERYVDAFQGNRNPQVMELRKQAEAEVRAFTACLRALEGNTLDLRLYSDL